MNNAIIFRLSAKNPEQARAIEDGRVRKSLLISRRKFLGCFGLALIPNSGLFKSRFFSFTYKKNEILSPRKSHHLSQRNKTKSKVIVLEGKDIYRMITEGLQALNLPDRFFVGKKIVIKPNTHWTEIYPSTTDPVSLIPVIDYLHKRKSNRSCIADGSGVDLPRYDAAFEFIGFRKVLRDMDADVIPLDIRNPKDFVEVNNPKWSVLERVFVHSIIYNSQVLISMTCLKRHGDPHLTAGLKNNIGAISARSRHQIHNSKGERMRKAIAEVADAVRPDITIVDARDILVKRGPMLQPDESNLKRGVHKIFVSTDMAALDTVASQLMAEHDETFHPEVFQQTLDHAYALNLGNIDPDRIELVKLRV